MKSLIRKLTGITLICAMLMSAVPAMAAEQTQWAIYIYMCGSNLESEGAASTTDIVEMMKADYPDSVKVVVFTGGSPEWNPYDAAQGYEQSGMITQGAYIQPSGEHNQLFMIADGKMELLKTYDGYMDMGDPATMEAFVKDAVAVAPAEHVMLEFWDHGGALAGAINDHISGGSLTLTEIRDAVAAAARLHGGKLDLVGFDTCLMSNLENAVLLSPYAQYLVASEEVEPGSGWDYSFLNLFRDWSEDRAITAVDLGQAIVDSYAASITDDGQWESNLIGTLALTDLSRIGAVETAYESFSAALLAQIKSDLARGETASYVNLVRIAETTQSMYDGMSMIDLYDFVYSVGQAFPSLSAQAGRVIAALGAPPGSDAAGYQGKVSPKDYVGWTVGGSPAVLYRGTGYPYNNCVGISVYYPLPDRLIPVEYAEKVYGSLAMDSYMELFAQEYVSASGVPVFDGKVAVEPTEQAFILNFSSADAAKSVKKVEYVTTYTELDGNEMKTFLLGTELIPEGWQDGSYSQVPYEDWYALGEHFITLEPVSFEAKSELTGYDTYTYKIYAAVGDNHGKETLAQLQAIRTVVPGDTSSIGMILTGASPIMQEGDDNAPRALMPEDIAYIRPAVAEYDMESRTITGYKVYDERVRLQQGNILPVFTARIISDATTSFASYFKVTDLQDNTYLSDPMEYFVIQSFDELTLGTILPKAYTGQPVKPVVRVLYHGEENQFREGVEYTVTYSDNVEKGTGRVTVTSLIDELPGTLTGTFTICDYEDQAEEVAKLLPEHMFLDGCEDVPYEYLEHAFILEELKLYYAYGFELSDESLARMNEQYAAYEKLGTFQDNGMEVIGAFRSLGCPLGDIKLSASRLPQAEEGYLTAMIGASDTLEECLISAAIKLSVRNEDGLYVPSSLRDSVALKLPLPQDSDVEALNGHMRAFILSEETGKLSESDFVLAAERNGEKYVLVHATQLGYIGVYRAEPPEPSAFTDVPAGAYYADAVTWALNNGVTAGTGDGSTFSPDDVCTRAQIMTFLWRAKGKPAPTSKANPFTDVDAGAYYYDAVLWAVENGITAGTGDGSTFDPNAPCTRAQIVAFLWRANNKPAVNAAGAFTDVPAGSYYADAVAWAVEKGVTAGTGDGTTFSPDVGCTRGQCVTFLYRDLA